MVEEIDFENGRISNFQRPVTLTLDRAIRHTVVHHSSTSTFVRIGETFCGRTDGRTYGQISKPALLGRLGGIDLTRGVRIDIIIIIIIIIINIIKCTLI